MQESEQCNLNRHSICSLRCVHLDPGLALDDFD